MRRYRVWLDLDGQGNTVGVGLDFYDAAGEPERLWCKPIGPFDSEWQPLAEPAAQLVRELDPRGRLF